MNRREFMKGIGFTTVALGGSACLVIVANHGCTTGRVGGGRASTVKDRINKDMMAYYQISIHVSYEDVQVLHKYFVEKGRYKRVEDGLQEFVDERVRNLLCFIKGEDE